MKQYTAYREKVDTMSFSLKHINNTSKTNKIKHNRRCYLKIQI